jgi:hypothetical protein
MTWNHFHSKPSTCKAVEWDNKKETFEFLKSIKPEISIQYVDCLRIPTREGLMIAYLGDYIVEDAIKGLYPCNAQVFHKRWNTTKKINKAKSRYNTRPHKIKNMTEDVARLIVQFNSEKEELHYTDAAKLLFQIKCLSNMSERDLVNHLDLSKSEVHRMVIIGRQSTPILDAAKEFNIEKYVLLEWDELHFLEPKKKVIERMILDGTMTKREQLQSMINGRR